MQLVLGAAYGNDPEDWRIYDLLQVQSVEDDIPAVLWPADLWPETKALVEFDQARRDLGLEALAKDATWQ